MKNYKNNNLRIKRFIDKNFGDQIEYCWIQEKQCNILIYSNGKKSIIFRTKNMDHLLQELIMLKEERDFLREENAELIKDLEN